MAIIKKRVIYPDNSGKFTKLGNLSGIKMDSDADLVAANILMGKNIFGVTGTHFDALAGGVEVDIKYGETIEAGDPVYFDLDEIHKDAEFAVPGFTFTNNHNVNEIAWSNDSQYVGLALGAAPYFMILKRTGDTYEKLPDPVDLPTSTFWGISCSSDGVYWTLSNSYTPFIFNYKRTGDTLAKLADPVALPEYGGRGVSMTKDGIYVAMGLVDAPFMAWYKRTNDVWAKLANPTTVPADHPYAVKWSNNGTYLCITCDNSNATVYHKVWKRATDVLTQLATPANVSVSNVPSAQYGIAWSPDDVYLACGMDISPWAKIYKRSGDTFSAIDSENLEYDSRKMAFHPDGEKLLMVHRDTTGIPSDIHWLNRVGDAFTRQTGMPPNITNTGTLLDAVFAPNGLYLLVGQDTLPVLQHWMYDLKAMKSANLRANIVDSYGAGIATEAGVAGDVKTVLLLLA